MHKTSVAHRPHALYEDVSPSLIVKSKAMEEVLYLVRQVAPTDASVLIQGESGTGKELVSRLLHSLSNRRNMPFLPINCAALPENLLEAELFGYEIGAFTGADKAKPGKFELANGGTLLLDEIGDMPLVLQSKILRVLEEKIIERLGGIKRIKVDVRVVAATNKNLVALVKEGIFREDLYYRLAVIPINIPPLRERREEIITQAEYFLNKFAKHYDCQPAVLTETVIKTFLSYPWPGNVRELRNLMERITILRAGNAVSLEDLPEQFFRDRENFESQGLKEIISGETEKLEKKLILDALNKYNGNRTKAADHLNVSRRWLQRKLKEYGIN